VNPGGFWVGIGKKVKKSNSRISLIRESKETELSSAAAGVRRFDFI